MGSAFFPIDNGSYRIPLKVRAADGSMAQIPIICDSGNDITLLKLDTANRLGYDPSSMDGGSFPVSGITAGPQAFSKLTNLIQIGNLQPIYVPMGLAQQQGSLAEDLLGRKGVWDSGLYTISQDERGITFTEKAGAVALLANAGGRMGQNLRSVFRGYYRW